MSLSRPSPAEGQSGGRKELGRERIGDEVRGVAGADHPDLEVQAERLE